MADVSIVTVKQGLECCQLRGNRRRCDDCVYGIGLCHEDRLHQDALEILNKLQSRNQELENALKFLLYWGTVLSDKELKLPEENAVRVLDIKGKTNSDIFPEIKDYWFKVKNEIHGYQENNEGDEQS